MPVTLTYPSTARNAMVLSEFFFISPHFVSLELPHRRENQRDKRCRRVRLMRQKRCFFLPRFLLLTIREVRARCEGPPRSDGKNGKTKKIRSTLQARHANNLYPGSAPSIALRPKKMNEEREAAASLSPGRLSANADVDRKRGLVGQIKEAGRRENDNGGCVATSKQETANELGRAGGFARKGK